MTTEIGTNVLISADQTAFEALAEVYPSFAVYTLEQQADDIDNLRTWTTDTVTFSLPTIESTDYAGSRHSVFALPQDERLLRVRKLRCFHAFPLLSQPEKSSRKLQL